MTAMSSFMAINFEIWTKVNIEKETEDHLDANVFIKKQNKMLVFFARRLS